MPKSRQTNAEQHTTTQQNVPDADEAQDHVTLVLKLVSRAFRAQRGSGEKLEQLARRLWAQCVFVNVWIRAVFILFSPWNERSHAASSKLSLNATQGMPGFPSTPTSWYVSRRNARSDRLQPSLRDLYDQSLLALRQHATDQPVSHKYYVKSGCVFYSFVEIPVAAVSSSVCVGNSLDAPRWDSSKRPWQKCIFEILQMWGFQSLKIRGILLGLP